MRAYEQDLLRLQAYGPEASRIVSRLQQQLLELERLTLMDPLTEALNRRGFNHATQTALARVRRGSPSSVAVVDIDHFKRINDTHGHVAGDKALQFVAFALRAGVREIDTLARYGGEEFAIIFDGEQAGGAYRAMDRIRQMIADTPSDYGVITVSVGVTELRSSDSPESALGRADAALYKAKRGGRNRVESSGDAEPCPPVPAAP